MRMGDYDKLNSRRTFLQLLDALSYCHNRGVYHGNLRPDALLLTDRGDLKVTGFNAPNSPHPLYSAPELRDGGQPTGAADAWGAGVVLHYLLTGAPPFTDCLAASRCELRCTPHLPDEAVALLSALLQPDLGLRIGLDEARSYRWCARETLQRRAPRLRRDIAQYGEREMAAVVRAAVPGRPKEVVERVVGRLREVDVCAGDDLAVLASLFKGAGRLARWLEEVAKLPTFTAVRLARFLYA